MVSREKGVIPRILPLVTAMVAVVIIIRVFWLIAIPSDSEPSYTNPTVAQQVVRGSIVDRHGTLIAVEVPYYSCALILPEIEDLNATAEVLGPIIDRSSETIVSQARQRVSYYLAKRRLNDTEYEQISHMISTGLLNGVRLEKRYGRNYPQHYHGAQVIGFTNTENRGIEGLELALEPYLLPYPELHQQVTRGSDVQLTIDMNLQYLLDEQVVAIDAEHFPDSVVGIIIGADTGEILAVSTFPWYNPNAYQLSEPEQRQNKVVTSRYEPGSVFKVFSLASELQAGEAHFDEPFHCDGSYTFTTPNGASTTIQCVSAHGTVTPEQMLQYSCNGAVAHWALQTDDTAFRDTLEAFGFTTAWNTGMPGAISGLLSPVETWSGRSKATISFGQELAITPLQIATAATAIATGGDLMTPYIVQSIQEHDGSYREVNEPTISRESIISTEVSNRVLEGMELATRQGGTATRVAVPGVRVGAKTGTAQIADPETGAYGPDTFLASTLAIVPVDDPKFIIYIGVENPKGATIWGSNIAAPAIGSIIADMVRQGRIRSDIMETVTLDQALSPEDLL